MKSILKFLLIFGGVLFLSAFLAPILHDFLPFKFGRIFNRLVMIFSLAAIVIFVRIRKEDLLSSGLIGRKDALYLFNVCFTAGFSILLILMAAEVTFGVAAWKFADVTWVTWIVSIVKVFFTALLIGVIEETFFRGFVFSKLKRAFGGVLPAVLLTSFFYSLIHFISGKKPFIGPDPVFKDSLLLMAAPFESLLHWQDYWAGAIGLFIFGVVLNFLYLRTRSLYSCIGLHAGCVFFIKLDGLFADSLSAGNLFWGTSKMYDGAAGWAALFSLLFFLNWFLGSKNENEKNLR